MSKQGRGNRRSSATRERIGTYEHSFGAGEAELEAEKITKGIGGELAEIWPKPAQQAKLSPKGGNRPRELPELDEKASHCLGTN